MNHRLAPSSVALMLVSALSACSSSNDDSAPAALADGGQQGETSMPAPDGDQPPLSSEPGGDTRAVAGYWDGSAIAPAGERYFVIAENGLWTEYFLAYEGDTPGNCYYPTEVQTLTPEDPAANAYSLADGRALTLVSDVERTRLTVGFVAEDRTEVWPAVVGRVVEDLPLCS